MHIRNVVVAAAAAGSIVGLLAGAGRAGAASMPVNGRDTSITVTGIDELANLGIGFDTNAMVDGIGRLVFPISGGTFDPIFLEGTLEHETDLGFTLSLDDSSVAFTNFVIDTTGIDFLLFATATITNGVSGPSLLDSVPLFALTFCNAPSVFPLCVNNDGSIQIDGYGLLLTQDAADIIGDAFDFDASSLVDSQFGIANIAISFVPEPGTLTLAGLGLAGLAASRRRVA